VHVVVRPHHGDEIAERHPVLVRNALAPEHVGHVAPEHALRAPFVGLAGGLPDFLAVHVVRAPPVARARLAIESAVASHG